MYKSERIRIMGDLTVCQNSFPSEKGKFAIRLFISTHVVVYSTDFDYALIIGKPNLIDRLFGRTYRDKVAIKIKWLKRILWRKKKRYLKKYEAERKLVEGFSNSERKLQKEFLSPAIRKSQC